MLHGKFLARGAAAGLLGLLMASSCGDDPVANDPTKFIGMWTISSGQFTPSCTGIPIPPVDLAGEVITVSPGVSSGLIALYRNCTIALDVAGNTATAKAGQSCDTSVMYQSLALSLKLSIASASFTVAGTAGTFMQSGQATLNTTIPLVPAGTGCPYTVTAAATKNP